MTVSLHRLTVSGGAEQGLWAAVGQREVEGTWEGERKARLCLDAHLNLWASQVAQW